MTAFFNENKAFIKRTVAIMVPVILQNLIIYLLNMMDSVMLSAYGQSDFAASSLANQAWFIYTLFMFGISSGTCILTSQYFGKKDSESINCVMHLSFYISFFVSVIMAAFLFFFPEYFMRIYTNEKIHIELGVRYLKIVSVSYIFTSFTVLYSAYLKSIEKAALPLIFNGISLALNTMLNYIFIFGFISIKPMGIEGAAIATLIARIVEFLIIAVYFIKYEPIVHLKASFSKVKLYTKEFFKYSGPVFLNESLWGMGISFQSAVFGRMGEAVVNAVSVNSIVERTGMIVCMGLYQAAAAILGIELGKSNFKTAKRYSKYYMRFSFGFGLIFAVIIYCAYPLICFIFNMPAETAELYRGMCKILSLLLVAKSVNTMGICAIMRSGGDSKAALLSDVLILLIVTNPLGAYFGLVGNLSPAAVYAIFISEEFIKMPIMFWRINTNKWLKNITV